MVFKGQNCLVKSTKGRKNWKKKVNYGYRNSIDVTLMARESLFAHAITNVPKLQRTSNSN